MQKNFHTNLSEKDLDKWIKQLKNYNKLMDEACRNIVKDLSQFGAKKMRNIHQQSAYKSETPMEFKIEGTEHEKTVSMSGQQAIYEEFGTGTMGAENQHPLKKEFELDDYNSHTIENGGTIRYNKSANSKATQEGIPVGGLYWTYKNAKGKRVYTQGIPAVREGYDSYMATLKKAPSVVKKRTEEVFNKGV